MLYVWIKWRTGSTFALDPAYSGELGDGNVLILGRYPALTDGSKMSYGHSDGPGKSYRHAG